VSSRTRLEIAYYFLTLTNRGVNECFLCVLCLFAICLEGNFVLYYIVRLIVTRVSL
jgi:hypothetical protein